MDAFFTKFFPNVVPRMPEFYACVIQTFQMLFISGGISFVLSLLIGITLVVTKRGGILQNLIIFNILDKIINAFRSIPFVILVAALIPVTRALVGTAVGTIGTIFPLIVGITPFFSRQLESAFSEVSPGLVESAVTMGMGPFEIIFRVYLREGISSVARATTITVVNLMGLTAIVGIVGGGGLGDFAIRYGYQRNMLDATYAVVILLMIFISIIELLGSIIVEQTTHE